MSHSQELPIVNGISFPSHPQAIRDAQSWPIKAKRKASIEHTVNIRTNMLIPIAAGIAAAVSRALIPPGLNLGATDRYLTDVDAHAKDFVERSTTFLQGVMHQQPQTVDGETASDNEVKKEAVKVKKSKPPPLPDTDDPLTLLGLDTLHPPTSFDQIKLAYKQKVKLYHPDLLGPDATEIEREEYGEYFKRINEAFELLKKREEDPDQFMQDMFDNRDQKSWQDDDPYHIDFDRIRRNAEYSKHKRMWYQHQYYYGPSIESHQSQRERWWQQHERDYVYEYDDVNYNQRGYYYDSRGDARQSYNWHIHRDSREYSFNTGAFERYNRNDGLFERREGYHKQRSWIDDSFNDPFKEAGYSEDQYDYYQSREGYHRFRDKWWSRGYDEYGSNLSGEFGP
jgi:curved DNA-binding protein CbpA